MTYRDAESFFKKFLAWGRDMTQRTQFLKIQMSDVRTDTRKFNMSAADTRLFHIPTYITISMRVVPRKGYKGKVSLGGPMRRFKRGLKEVSMRRLHGGANRGPIGRGSRGRVQKQVGHMKCPSDMTDMTNMPIPPLIPGSKKKNHGNSMVICIYNIINKT